MAGLSGLPQGEGPGLSARIVDDAASRSSRARAWTSRGHACLGKLVQGTLCKILNEQEVKPHKVRYYLERRDPEFKAKMAEVLCVYRQVKIIKRPRPHRRRSRATRWRSSPMTRSPASRR